MTTTTSPEPTESPGATLTSVTVPATSVGDVVLHLHGFEHADGLTDFDRPGRPRRAPSRSCPASARVTAPDPAAATPAPPPAARRGRAAAGSRVGRTAAASSGTHTLTEKRLPFTSTSTSRRTFGSASSSAGSGNRRGADRRTGRAFPRPTWSSASPVGSRRARGSRCRPGWSWRCPSTRISRSARSMRWIAMSRSLHPTRSVCRPSCRSTG